MNGVWTADIGLTPHTTIGKFTESNAIAFFQRCGELGLNAMVISSIPKDVREDFYAGKCVMISLGENRIVFVNMKIVSENKKKPL